MARYQTQENVLRFACYGSHKVQGLKLTFVSLLKLSAKGLEGDGTTSTVRNLQAQWVFEQWPFVVGGIAGSVGSYGCRPVRVAGGGGAYVNTYPLKEK